MMNRRWLDNTVVTLLTIFLASMIGCGDIAEEVPSLSQSQTELQVDDKPLIAATNAALQSMTKAIVGDFANVIRPQVEAKSEQGLNVEEVLRLQHADLVFTNGLGANDAAWLDLISLDESRVHATTSDEFELSDFIQVEDYRTVHSHGDEGEHSHPWLVPQSWLDPSLAKAQALSTLNRLVERFPDQESRFRDNYRDLEKQMANVESLAIDVAELVKKENVHVIVSDPRLLFFTRALNLDDDYLLWFDLPTANAAIAELQKRLPVEKTKTLLLWSQDAGSLNEKITDKTGIASATISLIEGDGLSGHGGDGNVDFAGELRKDFQTVKAALEGMKN